MTTDNKTLAGALTRFRCAGYDPTDGSGPIMVADPDCPWVLATDVIGTGSDCEATPASPDAPESGGDWFGDVLGSIGTVAPLADVQPGGRVRLGDALLPCPFCGNDAEFVPYKNNGLTLKCKSMGCIQRHQRTLRYGIDWLRTSMTEHWNARVLSAQPSPVGQDALAAELLAHAEGLERMAADDRETGLSIEQAIEDGEGYTPDEATDIAAGLQHDAEREEETAVLLRKAASALAARQPVGEPDAWQCIQKNGLSVGGIYRSKEEARLCGLFDEEIDTLRPLYAAPVQAVDLGAVSEAVRKA